MPLCRESACLVYITAMITSWILFRLKISFENVINSAAVRQLVMHFNDVTYRRNINNDTSQRRHTRGKASTMTRPRLCKF